MKQISISDVTIKKSSKTEPLSFKEKLELAKVLDKVCVDVIELDKFEDVKADSLLVKSIASSLSYSTLAVNADLYEEGIDATWEALKEARLPRLQIIAPASTARMEYDYHKKPNQILEIVKSAVSYAASLCPEVEFIANDATRADREFLCKLAEEAIEAGTKIVSFSDTAGALLPDEMEEFVTYLRENISGIDKISLGISCNDEMHLADACAVAAIKAGADEIKTCAHPIGKASLEGVAKILSIKTKECEATTGVRMTELGSVLEEVEEIFALQGNEFYTSVKSSQVEEKTLSADTDYDTLSSEIRRLGYDLADADRLKIYEVFQEAAKKKDVRIADLEAIIATEAQEVPETYKLDSYIVTTGNVTDVMAHIKLKKDDEVLDGISLGDGPIEAGFNAIENITGRHFELDEFQIQAISEGREALGQTLVKLRAHGKAYAGSGTSTDIIGASIKAYINALNKIVYEEEN